MRKLSTRIFGLNYIHKHFYRAFLNRLVIQSQCFMEPPMDFSETAWQIKAEFHVEPSGEGGRNFI